MMCTRAAMVRSLARWTTSGTSRSTQGVPRGVPTRTQLCTTTRGSTSTPLPGFSATTSLMGKAMRHRGRRPLCVSTHASAEGVYDDPRTYELAFGFREFEKEARFMSALSERMGTGRPMTSLLELGAGPAWHSTATATALPGAVAVAVDNAAPMLARARERVAHAKLTDRVAVVEGDMTSLDATAVIEEATKMNQDAARGFDVACVLLGTAAHLTDTDDAIGCLRGINHALAPGGIALLELEHPYDLFEGQLMDAQGDAWDREVDGVKVLVEWGREGDAFDVETHVVKRTVGFNVLDAVSGEPAPGFTPVNAVVPARVFTAPEIDLLARLAGMRVCGYFGDMDTDVPLDDPDAHNMLVVLKKDA